MLKFIFATTLLSITIQLSAQKELNVDISAKGAKIQPDMFGIFFEDINFGADGGLYAELIKNRSFEFDNHLLGWVPFGDVQVLNEKPCFDRNPNYVRLTAKGLLTGTGLENYGFRGIGFKQNDSYRFSFYARTVDAGSKKFLLELVNDNDVVIAKAEIVVNGQEWKKYETIIKTPETDPQGKIRLILKDNGQVDLDHISMFPVETWKHRENGLRKDIVQALYELNPGVFRFPGGCIVEGNTLATRYQWKNTIGPVENRPINVNRWNFTFEYRFFPDYYQSYGLGFYEYFLLSEDIGAEPLPVLNVGLACQYESTECLPVDDLEPYIQDAIDLIEFANGAANTKWGKVRSEMGHPEPFNLKMIAIGNEQWGQVYIERLKPFVEALRKTHPEIKIVGSAGPKPDGEQFDYLWPEMKKLNADLVDEHYYKNPEWFLANATRYDNYDRKGPKVFAGEYAAHPEGRANNLQGALSEAAFMTGLERNADIVQLATYAPLLAHVDAWQWKPDMIWFDNLSVVRTPNYYVQQMYANNMGTNVVPITINKANITGQDSLYLNAVVNATSSELIVKIVNVGSQEQSLNVIIGGLKQTVKGNEVVITELHSNNPQVSNSLTKPDQIVPVKSSVWANDKGFELTIPGNAFYVCQLKVKL